jgi:hypothetical protein
VTLNGVPIGTYTIASATTLTFTVPAGATSGPIAVTTLRALPRVLLPSLAAGSSDFTLTLTGTGFSSGSAVVFDGTTLATTYVSATQFSYQPAR